MTQQLPKFKPHYDNFIGGKFVAPVGGEYFENISPIDGKAFTTAARSGKEDVDRKDGTKQYVLRKMKPVFNPDGSIKIVVGCGVDITKRVNSEEKLQISEAKYRDLVNNLQDIIFNVDLDGYFTYLNPLLNH